MVLKNPDNQLSNNAYSFPHSSGQKKNTVSLPFNPLHWILSCKHLLSSNYSMWYRVLIPEASHTMHIYGGAGQLILEKLEPTNGDHRLIYGPHHNYTSKLLTQVLTFLLVNIWVPACMCSESFFFFFFLLLLQFQI